MIPELDNKKGAFAPLTVIRALLLLLFVCFTKLHFSVQSIPLAASVIQALQHLAFILIIASRTSFAPTKSSSHSEP